MMDADDFGEVVSVVPDDGSLPFDAIALFGNDPAQVVNLGEMGMSDQRRCTCTLMQSVIEAGFTAQSKPARILHRGDRIQSVSRGYGGAWGVESCAPDGNGGLETKVRMERVLLASGGYQQVGA